MSRLLCRIVYSNHFEIKRHILAAESGSIIIWEWPKRRVFVRVEQPSVKQIMLMEEDTKFLTASRIGQPNEGKAIVVVR